MEPPNNGESPPSGNSSWPSPTTPKPPIHLRPVTLEWPSDHDSSNKTPPSPKSPTDSILDRLKPNFSSDNIVHLAKNTGSFLLKSSGMKNSKNNAVQPTNDKKQ